MKERQDLLAYCGLYCGDCAGYTGKIADAATSLVQVLEAYKFDRTAKSLFSKELGDYPRLGEMLGFLSGLKCSQICREREDQSTSCEIRRCCRERGYYACYECDGYETCDKLAKHEELHGDACVTNLSAIKEMGLDGWIGSGQRLWFGSEVEV